MSAQNTSECLIDFGKWIKEGRERRGMLQSEVVEQLGITQSYYSMIENGQRGVDLQLAIQICKILRLDIGAFVAKYIK